VLRIDSHDQETEIRQVSAVFAQAKSENGETKKSRYVQDKGSGEEPRTRRSVFQAELGLGRFNPGALAASLGEITSSWLSELNFADLIQASSVFHTVLV
jgi:hypothetical protein